MELRIALRASFPAWLVHSYSNLGYTLLGMVVERVSGQRFDAYVRQHLFEPIGMPRASFAWTPDLEKAVAAPYDLNGRRRLLYKTSMKPAGALVASVHEMGAFASALLDEGRTATLHSTSMLARGWRGGSTCLRSNASVTVRRTEVAS